MTADPDTTIQIRLATEEDAELVRTLVLEFAAHQGDLRHVQATGRPKLPLGRRSHPWQQRPGVPEKADRKAAHSATSSTPRLRLNK